MANFFNVRQLRCLLHERHETILEMSAIIPKKKKTTIFTYFIGVKSNKLVVNHEFYKQNEKKTIRKKSLKIKYELYVKFKRPNLIAVKIENHFLCIFMHWICELVLLAKSNKPLGKDMSKSYYLHLS